MKKSYVLFITLVLVLVFSILLNFILEVNSLRSESFKQKHLFLQAKNHFEFLEEYFLNIDLKDLKSLKIEDDIFEIKAQKEKEGNSFLLSVTSKEFDIRLSKKIVKE